MNQVHLSYEVMGQTHYIPADKVDVKIGKTTWKLSVLLENLHEMIVKFHKDKTLDTFKI